MISSEHGIETDGRYHYRGFLDGKLVLHVAAETKASALSAAKILTLHELVRRDDIREHGAHESCEGCAFEREVDAR